MQTAASLDRPDRHKKAWLDWGLDLLLVLALAVGAYFRLSGVNWDENRHLHPDERFLTMVASAITPVESASDYFNTAESSLNPHNRGYGFYVYGTLPLFMVRYIAEWVGESGYDQIHLVGRQLSGIADLLTVFLTFLIASRLYRRSVGMLAVVFAAGSVLNIQLSHYFTVDTFTNLFGYLAVYAAVLVLTEKKKPLANWLAFVLFGIGLGMAAASKVNAVVLAVMLPLAAGIRWWSLPGDERRRKLPAALGYIALAALVSLLVFRICQPYAFSGPGFLGLAPNPKWVDNLKELSAQSSGDVDFPPALQWARRPVTFAWTNMVRWGLGLPLGLLAWAAFLWMAWRSWRGEWRQHMLLWGWTGAYFIWQSLSASSSMRYQLLIYPALAIIAAWGVITVWNKVRQDDHPIARRWKAAAQIGVILLGVGVAAATLAWAFAFTRIYHHPMTRVEASRWIYQNVPGPINLQIDTGSKVVNQPVAFRSGNIVSTVAAYQQVFRPNVEGLLLELAFPHIADPRNDPGQKTLLVTISPLDQPDIVLTATTLTGKFTADAGDFRGRSYQAYFDVPAMLDPQLQYMIQVTLMEGGGEIRLDGPVELTLHVDGESLYQSLPAVVQTVTPGQSFDVVFAAAKDGQLTGVMLPHVIDQHASEGVKQLALTVTAVSAEAAPFSATAEVSGEFLAENGGRGEPVTFNFDQPVEVMAGMTYSLELALTQGEGALAVYGSAPALESDWDDALPQPIDTFWPYDFSGGLYQNDLNLQLYWDDNDDKLKRFETTLEQADYLFISSNRQWGTTVRVPERYPLTSLYYRALLGCPAEKAITWCYAVAKPGLFTGVLGYDLVAVFQSDPNLGTVRFNTQFAEEAFTVYDHPKVLIFKKAASFDIAAVRQVLRAVDLSKVVHLTPKKATLINENPVLPFKEKYVAGLSGGQESSLDLLEPVWVFLKPLVQDAGTSEPDLLLPEDRLQEQQAGGTWSELFDREAFYNRYPGLGAFWFYLALSALGLVVYPLVRLAFPGLPDRGYPLSRLVGMLLLAYLVWLGGSLDIPFSSKTITWAFAILTVVGIGLAYLQRRTLVAEWRQHKRQYLVWELLTLAFFLFFLLIRLGNGDLWHTSHGGERPMEFSYLNAVIKSTSFPPYNPWFAGGYINYYYYGFVLVGTLIKWLGIIPSIAYNYVLPALFSMLAMGAFSFGWNLATAAQKDTRDNRPPHEHGVFRPAFWFGMASAVGLLILGNLGTVRQIWYGFQRLIIDPAIIEKAGFFSRWGWFFEGINKFLTQPGLSLPYPRGDWYWIPSRAIPGEPITEFPAFTFLWSDLHAHMMALPITVLAVAWAVGILLGRGRWGDSDGRLRTLSLALSFLVGGLVIGALYPTNSWDYPTYLLLVVAVLVYTLWRYYEPWEWRWLRLPANAQRLLVVLDAVVILGVLSYILYLPFWESFVRPLEDVYVWDGDRTPIWSYITHWGLFLFLIASWFIKETIDWMAATPLSSLRKLYPRLGAILALVAVWLVVVIFLAAAYKVQVAWLVLLLAAWALILIIRPGQADLKRLVLFMVGTGLVLTLLVEMVALRGDLGRMNMVFKFYMQAWVLLALSAAGSLIWLVKSLPAWEGRTRLAWQIGAGLLVFGAALFPLFGGSAKISNRMAEETPHTLDSMTYMAYAIYHDRGGPMDLSEDYWAIRWMQDNIQGSPVILEGNTLEYHWGSRYTIYTGLPGVVGWNWHQRQQRGKLPTEPVTDRIQEITVFYNTLDPEQAINILRKYDVRYFVVGQLEQQYYPGQGLDKFEELNGSLWQAVYHDRHTTIYEVLP